MPMCRPLSTWPPSRYRPPTPTPTRNASWPKTALSRSKSNPSPPTTRMRLDSLNPRSNTMPITGGYTLNHGDRYAGMVVDAQTSNSVSKLNKSGATVPWGVFVARDGDDGFTTVGTGATAADIIGVLRREINRAQADGAASGAP